jgi:hypothetical protein
MVQIRILSYIVPRLSQLFGWTVDTTALVDPLLKNEQIPKIQKQIGENVGTLQQKFYHPPPYKPPQLPKLSG